MNIEKREIVEKAVRELGGEFPINTEFHIDYYRSSSLDRQKLIHKIEGYICTRDEFNHVLADYRRMYEWDCETCEGSGRVLFASWLKNWGAKASNLAGECKFKWRTEYKPKSSSKPEGDNWHERGDKPPIGGVVEALFDQYESKWHQAKVIAHDGKFVIGRWLTGRRNGAIFEYTMNNAFRPIPSKRDKAIEQGKRILARATGVKEWDGITFEIEALYDAGWRPTSNNPE